MLTHLTSMAVLIGVVIALAELAVGVGALLGLWTRAAALGGLVLSLTLFLTVSFHSSPYYTGADIVFVFAWVPLLLAGSGGVWSLDGFIAARARHEMGLAPTTIVPIEFDVVRQVCGNFTKGRCGALGGADCDPAPCPFLANAAARDDRGTDLGRRRFVLGGTAAVVAGLGGLTMAGVAAGLGRLIGSAGSVSGAASSGLGRPVTIGPSPTTTPTTSPSPTTSGPTTSVPAPVTTHPPGTAIGPARAVPVGGAASFSDPSTGDPSIVLQPQQGQFLAYDAVCPHAGCTVQYSQSARILVCPCHGSEFNPETGAVEVGPAVTGLRTLPIAESASGDLYVR